MPQNNEHQGWVDTLFTWKRLKNMLVLVTLFTSFVMLLFQKTHRVETQQSDNPMGNALVSIDPFLKLVVAFAMEPHQLTHYGLYLFAFDYLANMQGVAANPAPPPPGGGGQFTTLAPTEAPTTLVPTEVPTDAPTTAVPTNAPTTSAPSTAAPSTAAPSTAAPPVIHNATNSSSLSRNISVSYRHPSITLSQRISPSRSSLHSGSASFTATKANSGTVSQSRILSESRLRNSATYSGSFTVRDGTVSASSPFSASELRPSTTRTVSLSEENNAILASDMLAILTNETKIRFVASQVKNLIVKLQFSSSVIMKLLLSAPEVSALHPNFDSGLHTLTFNGTLAAINQAIRVLRQSSDLTYDQARHTAMIVKLSDDNGVHFVVEIGHMGLLGNNTKPRLITPFPSVVFPLNQDNSFDVTPYWVDDDGDPLIFRFANATPAPLPRFVLVEGPRIGGQTNVPDDVQVLSMVTDWATEVSAPLNISWSTLAPAVLNNIPPQTFPVGFQLAYAIPSNTFNKAVTSMSIANLPNGLTFAPPSSIVGTPADPMNVTLIVFGTNPYQKTVNTTLLMNLFAIPTVLNNTLNDVLAPAGQTTTVAMPSTTFFSPYALSYFLVMLQNGRTQPIQSWIKPDPLNALVFTITPPSDQLNQNVTIGVGATTRYNNPVIVPLLIRIPPNIPPLIGLSLPDLVCFVGALCQYVVAPHSFYSPLNRTLSYLAETMSGTNQTNLGPWSFNPDVPMLYQTLGGVDSDIIPPTSAIVSQFDFIIKACDNVGDCVAQQATITIKYSTQQLFISWIQLGGVVVSVAGFLAGAFWQRINLANIVRGNLFTVIKDPFENGDKLLFHLKGSNIGEADFMRLANPRELLRITNIVAAPLKLFSSYLHECLVLIKTEHAWIVYHKADKTLEVIPSQITDRDLNNGELTIYIYNAEGIIFRKLRVHPNLFHHIPVVVPNLATMQDDDDASVISLAELNEDQPNADEDNPDADEFNLDLGGEEPPAFPASEDGSEPNEINTLLAPSRPRSPGPESLRFFYHQQGTSNDDVLAAAAAASRPGSPH